MILNPSNSVFVIYLASAIAVLIFVGFGSYSAGVESQYKESRAKCIVKYSDRPPHNKVGAYCTELLEFKK